MTDLAKLVVKLEAESSKLHRELDKSTKKISRFEKKATKATSAVGNAFKALGGIYVASKIGQGLTSIVQSAETAERQLFKLEALVKSTGGAAGLTAVQIDEMARSIARNTLASTEGVRDAASILLSFKSVSSDVFERTLELAQDMSATMGTDLKSSVLQLGKALEDPTKGLTAMARSGVSFTKAEEDMIKSMYKAGQATEAQGLILDKLAGQLGGTGKGESAGLTGAVDSLSQSWDELLEGIGKSGILGTVTVAVTELSRKIQRFQELFFPKDIERFNQLMKEQLMLKRQIASPNFVHSQEKLRKKLAEVRAEMKQLQTANIEQIKKDEEARKAGEAYQAQLKKQLETERNQLGVKKELKESQAEWNKTLDEGKALTESLRTPQEVYNDELFRYNEMLQELVITHETYSRAVQQAQDNFDEAIKKQEENGEKTKSVFEQMKEASADWSTDFADKLLDGELNFSNFVSSILKEMARIALSAALDPFFSAFAKTIGGVFSGGASLTDTEGSFAEGGRPPVGQPSWVGERGRELFVPDQAGTIIPNDMLQGGGTTNVYNQTLNYDFRDSATPQQVIKEATRRGAEQGLRMMQQDINSGGLTARLVGRTR